LGVRFTGYVRGLAETYAQTPAYAQLTAAHPAPPHFLHSRSAAAPVPTPKRDPCNSAERGQPGAARPTLWPSLQTAGAARARPAANVISFRSPSARGAPGPGAAMLLSCRNLC